MKRRYFAKPGTWFDVGTEAFPVSVFEDSPSGAWGIFKGLVEGVLDEESCPLSEFNILEIPDDMIPQ